MTSSASSLLLRKQLAELNKSGTEGFSAGLIDDDNIFKWQVLIMGPADTLYENAVLNIVFVAYFHTRYHSLSRECCICRMYAQRCSQRVHQDATSICRTQLSPVIRDQKQDLLIQKQRSISKNV
ncbi:Ubiquitin-conjugating enzyme E2 G1 [Taenia crassiceps]|uniref:Ubiquitin-conjugating enzyme E2 G1 n=1 Tax=Taenia crassiceps TaxID=6207 RepID=A0ABR4QGS1_9CEST